MFVRGADITDTRGYYGMVNTGNFRFNLLRIASNDPSNNANLAQLQIANPNDVNGQESRVQFALPGSTDTVVNLTIAASTGLHIIRDGVLLTYNSGINVVPGANEYVRESATGDDIATITGGWNSMFGNTGPLGLGLITGNSLQANGTVENYVSGRCPGFLSMIRGDWSTAELININNGIPAQYRRCILEYKGKKKKRKSTKKGK